MPEQQITCGQREKLIDHHGRSYNGFDPATGIRVISSGTNPDTGRRSTVWGYDTTDTMVLRDMTWMSFDGRVRHDKPCEHYIPVDA